MRGTVCGRCMIVRLRVACSLPWLFSVSCEWWRVSSEWRDVIRVNSIRYDTIRYEKEQ